MEAQLNPLLERRSRPAACQAHDRTPRRPLKLASEPGQGTTVTLYFPSDRVMAKGEQAAE